MKVLVVDDAMFMRKVLSEKLQKLGHVVLEAENGQQAIDRSCEENPDVVFMDIMMPSMDGISATRIIKKKVNSKVVMCTSINDGKKMLEALRAGASDYILKPFDDERIRESLCLEW